MNFRGFVGTLNQNIDNESLYTATDDTMSEDKRVCFIGRSADIYHHYLFDKSVVTFVFPPLTGI